jgi:kinesin family protein 5
MKENLIVILLLLVSVYSFIYSLIQFIIIIQFIDMNEHSSRSHSVFLINVKQENIESNKKLIGKLYLVDLAGSERVSKTGAEDAVLDEAKKKNKSLLSLANVIAALADGKPFVPYRDSKLTRVLQESLGGNARTTIIICCSPASYNEIETKSTLQFGQRAKTVKNIVVVNEELTAEEWKRRYEKEREKVARLKGHLARAEIELEKWRRGETVSIEDQVTLRLDAIDAELPASASTNSLASVQLTQPPSLPSFAPATSVNTLDQTYVVSPAVVSSDWEKERAGLYEQLDEKDDEINNQSQAIEKLKIKMIEQDEIINQLKKANDDLQSRISALEIENESQKDEVKEVLKALEELAMNFHQKQQEAESRTKENETLSLELDKKVANLKHTMDELETLKDNMNNQRKRILDMMITLLKDLGEIGVIIGGSVASDFKKPSLENLDNAEEDFTMARLYVSKMKGEIKLLTQVCSHQIILFILLIFFFFKAMFTIRRAKVQRKREDTVNSTINTSCVKF